MNLYYGRFRAETGGGLCQLSNLIYWMVLHTPLTVTERHRHSFDVFPDSNRTQPFGSGATCVYNYRDLQISNQTDDETYQICIRTEGDDLVGEIRTCSTPYLKYRVYEHEHKITHEYWGRYIRHNLIRRQIFDMEDNLVGDEYVCENHALMMYEPLISEKASQAGGSDCGEWVNVATKSGRMLVLILLVIVLSAGLACQRKAAQDDTNNAGYELTSQTYSEAGVQIDYPQIRDFGDQTKEAAINKLIKDEALKILQYYQSEETEFNLEIAFSVTWQSKGLLSVQYSGIGYTEGAAYPNKLFYTTNINLMSGEKIKLADVVFIDRAFIDRFRDGELVSGEEAARDELKAALQDYLSAMTADDLIALFHKADFSGDSGDSGETGFTLAESYSYFTGDSLGISIGVPHVLGDYAQYELKYSDIAENVNNENEIWQEILD